MDVDEEDLHVCLSCQATIIGLDQYVHHRRVSCPARHVSHKQGASSAPALPVGFTAAVSVEAVPSSLQGSHSTSQAGILGHATSTASCLAPRQNDLHSANSLEPHTQWSQNSAPHKIQTMSRTQLPSPSSSGAMTIHPKSSYIHVQDSAASCSIGLQTSMIKTSSSTTSNLLTAGRTMLINPSHDTNKLPTTLALAVDSTHSSNEGHVAPHLEPARPSSRDAMCPSGDVPSSVQSSSPPESTTFSIATLMKQIGSSEPLFEQGDATDEMAINISFPGRLPFKPASTTQVSLEVAGSLASLGQSSATAAAQTSGAEDQSEVLSAEVADPVDSMVASLSPGTSRSVVDTLLKDSATNEKENNFNDFFFSLELQKAPLREERLDHQKALRIANILNELAFSSDSEDFFPEEEEEGSEKEGEGGKCHPPKSHTGGKWAPSLAKCADGGKWKPSGKLEAMMAAKEKAGTGKTLSQRKPSTRLRGKRLPMLDDNSEEEEAEDNEDEVPEVRGHGKGKGKSIPEMARLMGACMETGGKRAAVLGEEGGKVSAKAAVSESPADAIVAVEGTYFCRVCNRTLNSQSGYERHLATAYHRKHVQQHEACPLTSPQLVEEEPIECTICLKSFNYKYNFARHLASAYHMRRARMCSTSLLLDESCQILLLRQSRFQCLVCHFFASQMEYFTQHLRQPAHASRCARLIGPLLCVRCKFRTSSNSELLQHVASSEHQEVMASAKRPCIIKESRKNLRCEKCDLTVHSATALVQHNKVHHGEDGHKPLRRLRGSKPQCPYCGSQWQSMFQLTIHIRRKHTKEKPFECKPCNKAFADKNALKSHLQTALHQKRSDEANKPARVTRPRKMRSGTTAESNLVKCKHCDFKVLHYRDLREHYLEQHANEMITCEPCGNNFVSYHLYTIHTLSKRHQAKLQLQDKQEVLRCQHCKGIFPDKQKLVLHEMAHSANDLVSDTTRDNTLDKLLVGVNPKYHEFVASIQNKSPSTLIACPECSRQLTTSNVIPHLRKHDGNAPYQCIMCVKTFYHPRRLQQHLQHHLEVREHQCSICNKGFYRSHHLQYHMETQHPREDHDVFVCSICSQQFVSKMQCTFHERKHDKPFKCHFVGCRYMFHSRIDLESHLNTHTNVRPFVCEECGYSAKSKRQLGYHQKNHLGIRNYLCDYCQYRGATKSHLQRHMRIHVGAKPYKCPYCYYSCSTLDNLGKHIQKTSKHRGLPMYPCSQCSFGTNHSKEFRHHLFSHHGVADSQVGTLSAYLGLYQADQDPKEVPEGGLALPVRERKTKGLVVKQEVNEDMEPEGPVAFNPISDSHMETEPSMERHSETISDISPPDMPSEPAKPLLSTLQPVPVDFIEDQQHVSLAEMEVSAPELICRLAANPSDVQLIWYSEDMQPLQFISEDPQGPSDVASCVEVTMASS